MRREGIDKPTDIGGRSAVSFYEAMTRKAAFLGSSMHVSDCHTNCRTGQKTNFFGRASCRQLVGVVFTSCN